MTVTINRTDLLADAKELFESRLHCSETVLQVFNTHLDLQLDDSAIRMATAFGGGFGNAKCSCGALTGAEMVVSALLGRVAPTEDCLKAAEVGRELHKRFVERFGSACCRVLTRQIEWGTLEHLHHCERITLDTVEILAQLLEEYDLMQLDSGAEAAS